MLLLTSIPENFNEIIVTYEELATSCFTYCMWNESGKDGEEKGERLHLIDCFY